MNLSARISNFLRHGDERSALWGGSHNCSNVENKVFARKVNQFPTVPL